MSTKTVATSFALALAGVGAINWWRGKRGRELVVDTAVYGTIVGTGLTVAGYLYGQQTDEPGDLGALLNGLLSGVSPISDVTGLDEGMGRLSKKAVAFLEQVNRQKVMSPYKGHGVKVDEVPEDPNMIVLHEE